MILCLCVCLCGLCVCTVLCIVMWCNAENHAFCSLACCHFTNSELKTMRYGIILYVGCYVNKRYKQQLLVRKLWKLRGQTFSAIYGVVC